ncbi:hypothetical protein ACA910_009505 [Epithemia clementina (nom. ined.)]
MGRSLPATKAKTAVTEAQTRSRSSSSVTAMQSTIRRKHGNIVPRRRSRPNHGKSYQPSTTTTMNDQDDDDKDEDEERDEANHDLDQWLDEAHELQRQIDDSCTQRQHDPLELPFQPSGTSKFTVDQNKWDDRTFFSASTTSSPITAFQQRQGYQPTPVTSFLPLSPPPHDSFCHPNNNNGTTPFFCHTSSASTFSGSHMNTNNNHISAITANQATFANNGTDVMATKATSTTTWIEDSKDNKAAAIRTEPHRQELFEQQGKQEEKAGLLVHADKDAVVASTSSLDTCLMKMKASRRIKPKRSPANSRDSSLGSHPSSTTTSTTTTATTCNTTILSTSCGSATSDPPSCTFSWKGAPAPVVERNSPGYYHHYRYSRTVALKRGDRLDRQTRTAATEVNNVEEDSLDQNERDIVLDNSLLLEEEDEARGQKVQQPRNENDHPVLVPDSHGAASRSHAHMDENDHLHEDQDEISKILAVQTDSDDSNKFFGRTHQEQKEKKNNGRNNQYNGSERRQIGQDDKWNRTNMTEPNEQPVSTIDAQTANANHDNANNINVLHSRRRNHPNFVRSRDQEEDPIQIFRAETDRSSSSRAKVPNTTHQVQESRGSAKEKCRYSGDTKGQLPRHPVALTKLLHGLSMLPNTTPPCACGGCGNDGEPVALHIDHRDSKETAPEIIVPCNSDSRLGNGDKTADPRPLVDDDNDTATMADDNNSLTPLLLNVNHLRSRQAVHPEPEMNLARSQAVVQAKPISVADGVKNEPPVLARSRSPLTKLARGCGFFRSCSSSSKPPSDVEHLQRTRFPSNNDNGEDRIRENDSRHVTLEVDNDDTFDPNNLFLELKEGKYVEHCNTSNQRLMAIMPRAKPLSRNRGINDEDAFSESKEQLLHSVADVTAWSPCWSSPSPQPPPPPPPQMNSTKSSLELEKKKQQEEVEFARTNSKCASAPMRRHRSEPVCVHRPADPSGTAYNKMDGKIHDSGNAEDKNNNGGTCDQNRRFGSFLWSRSQSCGRPRSLSNGRGGGLLHKSKLPQQIDDELTPLGICDYRFTKEAAEGKQESFHTTISSAQWPELRPIGTHNSRGQDWSKTKQSFGFEVNPTDSLLSMPTKSSSSSSGEKPERRHKGCKENQVESEASIWMLQTNKNTTEAAETFAVPLLNRGIKRSNTGTTTENDSTRQKQQEVEVDSATIEQTTTKKEKSKRGLSFTELARRSLRFLRSRNPEQVPNVCELNDEEDSVVEFHDDVLNYSDHGESRLFVKEQEDGISENKEGEEKIITEQPATTASTATTSQATTSQITTSQANIADDETLNLSHDDGDVFDKFSASKEGTEVVSSSSFKGEPIAPKKYVSFNLKATVTYETELSHEVVEGHEKAIGDGICCTGHGWSDYLWALGVGLNLLQAPPNQHTEEEDCCYRSSVLPSLTANGIASDDDTAHDLDDYLDDYYADYDDRLYDDSSTMLNDIMDAHTLLLTSAGATAGAKDSLDQYLANDNGHVDPSCPISEDLHPHQSQQIDPRSTGVWQSFTCHSLDAETFEG